MNQPPVFVPFGLPVTWPDPRGPSHLSGLTPALLLEKLVSSPVCFAEPGNENSVWPEGRRAKPGVIQKGLPDASPRPGQWGPQDMAERATHGHWGQGKGWGRREAFFLFLALVA